jgi:UDP-N-acetylmuramate dehydrogenase
VKILEHIPLAPYTTIGLGGAARWLVECQSEEQVREALQFAVERKLRVQVMGGGSNLIFPDAGFPGLVIRIAIGGVAFQGRGSAIELIAGAGVSWDEVVAESVARGLTGIECLSGFPGTVGGTPIQNVGAYGQEISETLVGVACLARNTGERTVFDNAACRFGYRTSRFKREDLDRYVVTEVKLRLRKNAIPVLRYSELAQAVAASAELATLKPGAAVGLVREAVLALRRRKSMVLSPDDPNTRSVGSFFLNPVFAPAAFAELERRWKTAGGAGAIPTFPASGGVKVPAAWLVEQAGFRKGYRKDGAGISGRHALALVNLGGTSAQLVALAEEIERGVHARFGVRLEREPVVIAY